MPVTELTLIEESYVVTLCHLVYMNVHKIVKFVWI